MNYVGIGKIFINKEFTKTVLKNKEENILLFRTYIEELLKKETNVTILLSPLSTSISFRYQTDKRVIWNFFAINDLELEELILNEEKIKLQEILNRCKKYKKYILDNVLFKIIESEKYFEYKRTLLSCFKNEGSTKYIISIDSIKDIEVKKIKKTKKNLDICGYAKKEELIDMKKMTFKEFSEWFYNIPKEVDNERTLNECWECLNENIDTKDTIEEWIQNYCQSEANMCG